MLDTTGTLIGIEIRRELPGDREQVLRLLRRSLGKRDEDPYEDFFRWKHRENPLGESPAWIAVDGDRVVGFRTFLKWEFLTAEDHVLKAVRAVDTATDPDYRGRGIFRALTLRAIADLTLAETGIVFNTPNDQSRPGYLKMGWTEMGRLRVGMLPSGARGVARMAQARVPASLWSEPCSVGVSAPEALGDGAIIQGLLTHCPKSGFRTRRSAEYLKWRTSFGPLHYRLLLASAYPQDGGLIFRLRRRGQAVEAAVTECLVPDRRTTARLVTRLLRQTRADYVIGLRSAMLPGLIPLPRQGPLLTARPLAAPAPPAGTWRLSLGDIELF